MAKGSQLTQLKSALTQAGLNRQSQPSKKRKHVSSTREAKDKDKKEQKLLEIQRKLNPFDVKVTKLKHDVGGRKLKGVSGRPQESKQAGLEKRKKTLLKEYEEKNHAGGIIDRRFGESDPTMTPEERMLERFTKERQRASRGTVFNLEDEDELTHYGQSLSKMDDFDDAGIVLDDDDESDGKIDRETVKAAHFGGFSDEEEDEEDDGPPRKKSKAEVMAEVIAKSKQHKHERQIQKQLDADTRHQLDQELDDIRHLLFSGDKADTATSKLEKDTKEEDQGYDQHVRELALDKRAKPKDRTKTEEEQALEAKEALEKAERKRQRRMLGENDDSSDEENVKKRKRTRREAGGDDLEDDFDDENAEAWDDLGAGLEEGSEEEETGSEEGQDSDDEEDEEDEDDEEDEEEVTSADDSDESEEGLTSRSSKFKSMSKGKGKETGGELPYTFPCPESLDDFLEITENVDVKDIPTVIERIRALYHPSLGADNKFKLQAFAGILIEYIIHVSSPPDPSFALLPSILPHLHSLAHSYPIETATHFISKLKIMQKNLTRGLNKGALSPDSRTWPGSSELAVLWIISHIWPTSDMNHHVVSPSRLLMGSYLGLCRIRSLRDLASSLFLCTLFLRYEKVSKRLVPEVVNCILNAILLLAPSKFKSEESLPGAFPCPDFDNISTKSLRLNKKKAKSLRPNPPDLIKTLNTDNDSEQTKLDLLSSALKLIAAFADMYKGLDGFIELFQPAFEILDGLNLEWASEQTKTKLSNTKDMISRLLKFARQSRRPLALQAHKPIPIATYIPKFESNSSSYIRNRDPDHERAAASKLRYQLKQERKGAIRELRKDARFLSAVKQKQQDEKDRVYAERMKKVFSSLEGERAEQKKMDREKAKEKKRSGRN